MPDYNYAIFKNKKTSKRSWFLKRTTSPLEWQRHWLVNIYFVLAKLKHDSEKNRTVNTSMLEKQSTHSAEFDTQLFA